MSATLTDAKGLAAELSRFGPKELVLCRDALKNASVRAFLDSGSSCLVENVDESRFDYPSALDIVNEQVGSGMDLSKAPRAVISACGGLLDYLHETQKSHLEHISFINIYSGEQFMQLDFNARRNLEPVSYTHLDVYKRQSLCCAKGEGDEKDNFDSRQHI